MFDYDPRISCSNKNDIVDNIMNSFSSMYLTMISIVQGVALSLLVFKVPQIVDWGEIFSFTWKFASFLPLLIKIAYLVTTFLLIVLTWHSYFWLAAIARWVPTIWDSILFFVHGAFELMLIDSLSHLNSFMWFYLFAFIGVISAMQYKYNSKRLNDTKVKTSKNNLFKINIWQKDVERLGNHVAKYKRKRAKLLIISSVLFFIVFGALDLIEPNSRFSLSCVTATFVEIFKYISIILILSIHLILICLHIKSQKKSLIYLRYKDTSIYCRYELERVEA